MPTQTKVRIDPTAVTSPEKSNRSTAAASSKVDSNENDAALAIVQLSSKSKNTVTVANGVGTVEVPIVDQGRDDVPGGHTVTHATDSEDNNGRNDDGGSGTEPRLAGNNNQGRNTEDDDATIVATTTTTTTTNTSNEPLYPVETATSKAFDGITFQGEVFSYEKTTKHCKIRNEDGDEEELDLKKMKRYAIVGIDDKKEEAPAVADEQLQHRGDITDDHTTPAPAVPIANSDADGRTVNHISNSNGDDDQGSNDKDDDAPASTNFIVASSNDDGSDAGPKDAGTNTITTNGTIVATTPAPTKKRKSVTLAVAGSKCLKVEFADDDDDGNHHLSYSGNGKLPSLGKYAKTPASDAMMSKLKKAHRASALAANAISDVDVSEMTPAQHAKARHSAKKEAEAATARLLLSDEKAVYDVAGIKMEESTDDNGRSVPVVVSAMYAHKSNFIGSSITVASGGKLASGRVEGLGDTFGTYWVTIGNRRMEMDRSPIDEALNYDDDSSIEDLFAYQSPAKANRSVAFDSEANKVNANDDSWVAGAMGLDNTPFKQFGLGGGGVVKATERQLDEDDPRRLVAADEQTGLPVEATADAEDWSLEGHIASPNGQVEATANVNDDDGVQMDVTRSIDSEDATVEYSIPGEGDGTLDTVNLTGNSAAGVPFADTEGGEEDEETATIVPENNSVDGGSFSGETASIVSEADRKDEETATIMSENNSVAGGSTKDDALIDQDVNVKNETAAANGNSTTLSLGDIHVPSFFAGATFVLFVQLAMVAYIVIFLFLYNKWNY